MSRAMVCRVLAECLEVPNLWTKHAAIDQSRIESTGNHYPDYSENPSACSMSTLSGAEIPEKIKIGHVTTPFRPTVAPSGIGIVFQTRMMLPIVILRLL
jgi:hypothetical protein